MFILSTDKIWGDTISLLHKYIQENLFILAKSHRKIVHYYLLELKNIQNPYGLTCSFKSIYLIDTYIIVNGDKRINFFSHRIKTTVMYFSVRRC